jgi:hypothetical protein
MVPPRPYLYCLLKASQGKPFLVPEMGAPVAVPKQGNRSAAMNTISNRAEFPVNGHHGLATQIQKDELIISN